jgi:hypothetical protein
MPYAAEVYRVMIASPRDVPLERGLIREVIHEWNSIHAEDKELVLMPIGWETDSSPAMGDRAQAILNKQVLKDCDLLVAVFWTRLESCKLNFGPVVPNINNRLRALASSLECFAVNKPKRIGYSSRSGTAIARSAFSKIVVCLIPETSR